MVAIISSLFLGRLIENNFLKKRNYLMSHGYMGTWEHALEMFIYFKVPKCAF